MFHRTTTSLAPWLALGLLLSGCGGSPEPADPAAETPRTAGTLRSATQPDSSGMPQAGGSPIAATAAPGGAAPGGAHPGQASPEQFRLLADLLGGSVDSVPRWIADLGRMRVDDARTAAAGIRKLSGKRLVLYTDLPPDEEVEELPEAFGQAFPQWCDYFGIDAAAHPDWYMTAFLMKDRTRFEQAGLLPERLPPFEHGFSWNYEIWLYEQPSAYYRRHLLLHEGTHGLMNSMLGGCGPAWYMEGMADLLATHRWQDGRLTLGVVPADRSDVPRWARIRMIKDAMAAGRPMALGDVVEYPFEAFLEVDAYAWSWAAALLLDRHPRYRDRFHELPDHVIEPAFNRRFYGLIGDDWDQLCEEWRLLIDGLEYGHDIARTAIDFTPGRPLPPTGARVTVAADRGWQNSGLRLDGGADYRLRASGRYQVADEPRVWWCEPGGISIRYYRSRPLGILLAAVRGNEDTPETTGLLRPIAVGLGTTLVPTESGTLYLKINDSAAELDDNAGELHVEIRRE